MNKIEKRLLMYLNEIITTKTITTQTKYNILKKVHKLLGITITLLEGDMLNENK